MKKDYKEYAKDYAFIVIMNSVCIGLLIGAITLDSMLGLKIVLYAIVCFLLIPAAVLGLARYAVYIIKPMHLKIGLGKEKPKGSDFDIDKNRPVQGCPFDEDVSDTRVDLGVFKPTRFTHLPDKNLYPDGHDFDLDYDARREQE